MLQLVADIKGKKVYSDKRVVSIVNNRVTFSDGSWCDVAIGHIVNKGSGYINIGSPEEGASEKVTVGPNTYSARNLEVRDMVADLDVQVHQANAIEVIITGPDHEVQAIRVSKRGDTVVIEGEGGESALIRSDNVVIRRGGGSIIGGDVVIGRGRGRIINGDFVGRQVISVGRGDVVIGGDGENQTKIVVKVPKGASVNVSGISGATTIGDTEGPLQADASDGGITAGSVTNATLSVQGHSDITVAEVNGALMMSVMGSGNVSVKGGNVFQLMVHVMGSGDASFHGQAQEATLTVAGSGDIHVANVKTNPIMNVMGSGGIRVPKIG